MRRICGIPHGMVPQPFKLTTLRSGPFDLTFTVGRKPRLFPVYEYPQNTNSSMQRLMPLQVSPSGVHYISSLHFYTPGHTLKIIASLPIVIKLEVLMS